MRYEYRTNDAQFCEDCFAEKIILKGRHEFIDRER